MENLFNQSIKVLHTDCGSEYTNNEFTYFCSQSSIFHQFTCPHTSQQNNVAKRKHRHIVDMALTLISQTSLPFQYWSYAFSTVVFLINRLPSIHHHYTTPWETLFGKSPNYSLFKSFGCVCYPLLCPYFKHKFNFRSQECNFLGYASSSKGYLCLDPFTSRIYLSHHVVFHETHFPFSILLSINSNSSSTASNSNSWLSTLLFFHPCQSKSILGPIPVHVCPTSPPPLYNTIPSILGPIPSIFASNPTEPIIPQLVTEPIIPYPIPEPIIP